jgi:hypothetical protein
MNAQEVTIYGLLYNDFVNLHTGEWQRAVVGLRTSGVDELAYCYDISEKAVYFEFNKVADKYFSIHPDTLLDKLNSN